MQKWEQVPVQSAVISHPNSYAFGRRIQPIPPVFGPRTGAEAIGLCAQ